MTEPTFLGRPRDLTKLAFGNTVKLEVDKMDDGKPDHSINNILKYNFERSRDDSEHEEFKTVAEPEYILGPIYEEDGVRYRGYGWFVEVEPVTEAAKAAVAQNNAN